MKKNTIILPTFALLNPGLSGAQALPLHQAPTVSSANTTPVEKVRVIRRGVAVRRCGAVARRTVVGPRGVARRTTVVRPVYRGAWVRPNHYWWRPGAAVAAGAAIGWVAAATAVAWAGPAPGPNMCWYYTNSARTKGFWDRCP